MPFHYTDLFSTYSIVARDPATGELGVAVQTHQMSVGRIVPWLLPGVGAIATQSMANVSFGPTGLRMLREGLSAPHVLRALIAGDDHQHRRQIGLVDAQGLAAAHTGTGCIAEAGHHVGEGYSVQANMMTRPTVVDAMTRAYESTSGDLAQRMMAALIAAQTEDGDIRGKQSAALKVVPGDITKRDWETVYDLRVDEHADPVTELARLVRLRNAQLIDQQGYQALESGSWDAGLQYFTQAREQAPELEELAFWQAVNLADKHSNIAAAAHILRPVIANDERRDHWLDLIGRLAACGLIEREGTDVELIEALNA